MRTDFNITVKESSRELTAKEKVQMCNLALFKEISEVEEPFTVDGYALLAVHNEHTDNETDYEKLILFSGGEKIITGAKYFIADFLNYYNILKDTEEEWKVRAVKKESRNYKGKTFLACEIV